MKNNFLQLAKEQFLNLKEEILDLDIKALGSEDVTSYENDGVKFKIKVDGCWEKATWFDYKVYDEQENIIETGNYCF